MINKPTKNISPSRKLKEKNLKSSEKDRRKIKPNKGVQGKLETTNWKAEMMIAAHIQDSWVYEEDSDRLRKTSLTYEEVLSLGKWSPSCYFPCKFRMTRRKLRLKTHKSVKMATIFFNYNDNIDYIYLACWIEWWEIVWVILVSGRLPSLYIM